MIDKCLVNKLRALSNEELFSHTKTDVHEETNATLKVLYDLREIQRRRAFAEKSYPTIFEFCVEYLGYKRDAAYRKIAAMNALQEMPEVEEKLKEGSLCLTTLAQAQTYFVRKKRERAPLTRTQKLDLLTNLENKSVRQTDEFFSKLKPKEIPKETLTLIDDETYEWKLALPKRVYEKLQQFKAHLGAEKASVDSVEALERALDMANKECERKIEKSELKQKSVAIQKSVAAPGKSGPTLRTKRLVWKRDQSQCAFIDKSTGKRCPSKYCLEVDHIIPRAKGGSNELENLRLACRAHNQLAAIKEFGLKTMSRYFVKDRSRPYILSSPTLNYLVGQIMRADLDRQVN